MNLTITNAKIITPGEILPKATIKVSDGKIAYLDESGDQSPSENTIDAQGKIVMPGIIDLHTDAMEHEIIPRPGADFPIEVAFLELERKMAGCGITTVYHSMHLGYKSAELNSRSKYKREDVFNKVYYLACQNTHINNKIHLRFELTGTYHYQQTIDLLNAGKIDLLSVMDHTPGQGQYQRDWFIKERMNTGKSQQEAEEELLQRLNQEKIEGERLQFLIDTGVNHKIPVASHDDDTPEKVQKLFEMGVRICEFPINLATSRKAKALEMYTIGGGSNILRGGSLSGNLNVLDGIRKNLIDAICSDYYPPSILHSIFKLFNDNILPLHQAVNLATLNPAKAVGLEAEIGSIEVGKNADILIVDIMDNLPLVTHTIVNGNVTSNHQIQSKKKAVCQ